MIKSVIRSFAITAFAFWLILNHTGLLALTHGLKSLALIIVGFTLIHLLIKPAVEAVMGSLNFLTFGLIGILIDAAILFALTMYLPEVKINPWHFSGIHESGFTIPQVTFNSVTGSVLCATIIGIIRTALEAVMS